MLTELEIRNLGPIRHAVLEPGTGMTAITGETGAGKSMLLNAVRLISGSQADAGRVSAQADETWVQGVFTIEQEAPAARMAQESGIDPQQDDGELFLTRTVPAQGRSRSLISGHAVPRSLLSQIAGNLVVVHGQSDQMRIASSTRQREFLDAVAHDQEARDVYAQAWNQLAEIDQRLQRLTKQEDSDRQRGQYLRESIERIGKVDPQSGEDDDLVAKRDRIEHATQIAQGVGEAVRDLSADEVDTDADVADATTLIQHAIHSLQSIHVGNKFDDLADRLASIDADISDIVFSLADELKDDAALGDLDQINARIYELGELTRRWGPTIDDVLAWRDQAQLDVQDLDASPEQLAQLGSERAETYRTAVAAATALSERRQSAASRLESSVNAELGALAMAGSRLHVTVRRRAVPDDVSTGMTAPLDAHGMDDVAFMFTPFPGAQSLPLGKSASGGELSRLMLALELAAAGGDTASGTPTFIFDEIDAGVGGKSAVELAKRLARLAEHAQVIVVTHLAQVASWATTQYVVSRPTQAGAPHAAGGEQRGTAVIATTVRKVEGDARVHEIARMLSGSESDTSLDHARELLQSSVF